MTSWTDETQTILPVARESAGRGPCPIIARAAARVHRNIPVRFTPRTVFHCSSVISVSGASRCRPELLTRMSMRPQAPSIAANIASTSLSRATSARIARASAPAARRSATTRSAPAVLLE
jgi:hypothetical protein